jgi:transcriptional regulator with XRE-family HTH domain
MIIRKLRLQRGWTQEHLAELTGLSVRSIQRLERGQAGSLETLNALAAVFEVERSVLNPGESVMNNESALTSEEAKAMEYVKGLRDFYAHVFMYLTFVVVFGFAFGFDRPLIYWGALGWGAGLAIHGLTVHEVIKFLGPAWEKKQIEKRLGRQL